MHAGEDLRLLAGEALEGGGGVGGVGVVVHRGAAGISVPFLEALKRQGLRIREYRVPAGGRAEVGGEASEQRVEDVPFDPAAGEVLFLPSAAALRKRPVHTVRVRLVAVDEAGERALGEYTFAHTPG